MFFYDFSSNSAGVADHAAKFSMKTPPFRGEDVINNSRGAFGGWALRVPEKHVRGSNTDIFEWKPNDLAFSLIFEERSVETRSMIRTPWFLMFTFQLQKELFSKVRAMFRWRWRCALANISVPQWRSQNFPRRVLNQDRRESCFHFFPGGNGIPPV